MAFPAQKKEVLGALVVAAGLLLGGALSYIGERVNLPMPGLLISRPEGADVEKAVAVACAGEAGPETAPKKTSAEETVVGKKPTERASDEGATEILEVGRVELRGRRLGPIDINSAPVEELQKLDGIGPVLAARIVELRNRKGPFRRIEDLLEVKGIGPATLARIRASAGVGPLGSLQNTLRTSTSTQADSSAFHR